MSRWICGLAIVLLVFPFLSERGAVGRGFAQILSHDVAIERAIEAITVASSSPPDPIHDAVVRVIAVTPDGIALGSGTLIAVSKDYGLVLTNWHVVNSANRPVQVAFSGGYRSFATVLKMDSMWDIAALAIRRPPVQPLRISLRIPVVGEPLRIAGYGDGTWRCIQGNCTQFVAPDPEYPFEMVELSVAARLGDSGGPILNRQNELVGVLFGAAEHCTTGSHCGRVATFLDGVMSDFQALPEGPLPIEEGKTVAASPKFDLPTSSSPAPTAPPKTFVDPPKTFADSPNLPSDPFADSSTNPPLDPASDASSDTTESSLDTPDSTEESTRRVESSQHSTNNTVTKNSSDGNGDEVPKPDGQSELEPKKRRDACGEETPAPKTDSLRTVQNSPTPPQEVSGWIRIVLTFLNRPVRYVCRDLLAIVGAFSILRWMLRTALRDRRRRRGGDQKGRCDSSSVP